MIAGADTGLTGTSFAAPIIAGNAAILGSKFDTNEVSMVADRLLSTARTDTIANHSSTEHGQGEADINAAVAPTTVN